MASVYLFGNIPFIYHKDHCPNLIDRFGGLLTSPIQKLHCRFHPLQFEPHSKGYLDPKKPNPHCPVQHPHLFKAIYIFSIVLPILDMIGCLFRGIALIGKETRLNRIYLLERQKAIREIDEKCKEVEKVYSFCDLSEDSYWKGGFEKSYSIFKDINAFLRKTDSLFENLANIPTNQELHDKLKSAREGWNDLTPEQRSYGIEKPSLDELVLLGQKAKAKLMNAVPAEDKNLGFPDLKVKYQGLWEKIKPVNEEAAAIIRTVLEETAQKLQDVSISVLNFHETQLTLAKERFQGLLV